MKTLKCRNIVLNNENTKVCIPIVGRTKEEMINQASAVKEMNPDIVEFRADFLSDGEVIESVKEVHEVLGEIPLIFTFRTANEGGEKSISFDEYSSLCLKLANLSHEYNVAFVDVEVIGMMNKEGFEDFMNELHKTGVKIIGSNHHFDKTPEKSEMVHILTEIEKAGADVCKLAVMPKYAKDVNKLIDASKEADNKLNSPIITMAMGELGAVTRVCTRLTGSVLTFASGVGSSAPGQLECSVVKKLLRAGKNCSINGNIVLIGFMGTGKSTISSVLSKITGLEEVDVDAYIVEKSGMKISDIFEQKGEKYFRNLETQALKEIQQTKGQIVACGGGAVLKDENVEILKDGGIIVLLTATPETVFDRVKNFTHRPILNSDMSLKHVKELMQQREPRYQAVADVKVNVDQNDRVMTCYDIIELLEEHGIITIG